jgi:hypothetical protein
MRKILKNYIKQNKYLNIENKLNKKLSYFTVTDLAKFLG